MKRLRCSVQAWPPRIKIWVANRSFSRVKERALAVFRSPMHRAVFWNKPIKKARGFVSWDAIPPANCSWPLHTMTFVQAIEMASQFIETDYTRERETLIVGKQGRILVEMYPSFVPAMTEDRLVRREGSFAILGTLNRRKIAYTSHSKDRNVLFNETNERYVPIYVLNWI